uniref:C-type lectin domain-containing protein n=1 Tax=Callithrix jacchus TaxID=9483 RepID=A0A8I3WE38_CALJA
MNLGNLVSVLTQSEGTFVASLIKESGTDDFNVWIGLRDPKKNRCWHWSSGSLVSYKSWDIGAPSSTNPGYCVSLTSSSGKRQRIHPPVSVLCCLALRMGLVLG